MARLYETANRNRVTVLKEIDRRLRPPTAEPHRSEARGQVSPRRRQ